MTANAIPSGIAPHSREPSASPTAPRSGPSAGRPMGEPWAVALVVHGLGEHAGRYRTVAGALTDAGIDVFAYDQRGLRRIGGRARVRGPLRPVSTTTWRSGCSPSGRRVPACRWSCTGTRWAA